MSDYAVSARKLLLFLLVRLFLCFYVMLCVLCVVLKKIWMDSHLSYSSAFKETTFTEKIPSYQNGKEDNRNFWFLSILRAALDLPTACIRIFQVICTYALQWIVVYLL